LHESAESAAGPASQLAVTTESHALPDCAQCAGIVWVTPRGRVDSQWQTLLGGFRPLNPAPWEGSALLRGFWNLVFHFRGYAKKKSLASTLCVLCVLCVVYLFARLASAYYCFRQLASERGTCAPQKIWVSSRNGWRKSPQRWTREKNSHQILLGEDSCYQCATKALPREEGVFTSSFDAVTDFENLVTVLRSMRSMRGGFISRCQGP
jgi:hypothetical protein